MEKSVKDQPEVSAEAITRKMICYGLFTVPVTILSLLLLILIIYFGSRGIENQCTDSTLIDFVQKTAATIRNTLNNQQNGMSMTKIPDNLISNSGSNAERMRMMYIWLTVASGCGLLWTFVTLVALKLLVEFLVRYHHYLEYYRKKEKNGFKSTYNKDAKLEKEVVRNPLSRWPTVDEPDHNPEQDHPDKDQSHTSGPGDQNSDQGEIDRIIDGRKIVHDIKSIGTDFIMKDWSNTQTKVHIDKEQVKKTIDKVGKYIIQEYNTTGLRSLTPLALVGLFFSLLFFMAAVICLLFGVAIASDRACQRETSVIFYMIVGLLDAIILPLCLFVSWILLATVIEFITFGNIEIRLLIPTFLRPVKFLEGEKNDYWVILDRFYFLLAKRNKHKESSYLYSFKLSSSTWFIIVIILTSIHLTLTLFMDATLISQVTAASCSDPRLDMRFDCFEPGTLREYINCTENGETTNTGVIHCYRFHVFGVDEDLFMHAATAFAFYLATMAVFQTIFSVVNILMYMKPGRLWGFAFFGFGVLGIVATVCLFVLWIIGFMTDKEAIQKIALKLSISNMAQILMVCIYSTTIGLLLTLGKWWERVPKASKIVPRGLFHFDSTDGQTAQLEKDIEGEGNEEAPQKKDGEKEGTADTRL